MNITNTENSGSLTLLGVFFEKSNSMLVTLKIQCYVVRFLGDLNFTVSEATSNSEFSLLAMKISLLAEIFPVAMGEDGYSGWSKDKSHRDQGSCKKTWSF